MLSFYQLRGDHFLVLSTCRSFTTRFITSVITIRIGFWNAALSPWICEEFHRFQRNKILYISHAVNYDRSNYSIVAISRLEF